MNTLNPTVLLVEDNENDIFFMKRIFTKGDFGLSLQVVTHGKEAIDYLKGKGKYQDRGQYPLPALIFLDLKLPYFQGFEVLAWIRTEEAFATIPVIILTSSIEDKDQEKAKIFGVSFLVKPPTIEMILPVIQFLKNKK
ncbi:MAG: response regulator [Verrucomicrobiota bacterium]